MPNAMSDLERLLDAAGILNHHYISFDNPPGRVSQEYSSVPEEQIKEEASNKSLQAPEISRNSDGESSILEVTILDASISTKDLHHISQYKYSDVSVRRTEEQPSILRLLEHQSGSSTTAGLTDPSRHAPSAFAGSAVRPRTTLDRLRAGEGLS